MHRRTVTGPEHPLGPCRVSGARSRRRRPWHNGPVTVRRRAHVPLSVPSSHWREDGSPKNRYPSRADALAVAADRAAETGLRFGAYRCDYCDDWHIGRQLPPDDPRR